MPHKEDITQIGWTQSLLTTANTAMDGTGTVLVVFGPYEKTVYLDRIEWLAAGTNTQQTVGRLFINNGDDHSESSNNSPLPEATLFASTIDHTTKQAGQTSAMDLWVPAGFRILATIGTSVDAGWSATAIAGQYSEAGGETALYTSA